MEGAEQCQRLHKEPQNREKHEAAIKNMVLRPVVWIRMLIGELHWSLVVGIMTVYGVSQGFGMGLCRVTIQYYMKDDLELQPSESQIYSVIFVVPWIIRPIWGLLTDVVPVSGFRRRPYFVFAGSLLASSMLLLSLHGKLTIGISFLSLMAGSAGMAIADVTMDACVTESSISHPSLAGDMQTLAGVSSSVGALFGFSISGFLIHLLGSKGVLGVISIPGGFVILLGLIIKENRMQSFDCRQVNSKFVDSVKAMLAAMKCRDVWRPCLYMYLSLALSLNVYGGMFYWYTDAKAGPAFSQEAVGSMFSVGSIGSLLGVLLYQNVFKNHPFRAILLWAQLLFGVSGLLDLALVLRINLKFGIPDYLFAVIDECVTQMIGRIKWMPLLVLSSKLCPSGIEGTFFALIMSIDQIGFLSSSWTGGLFLRALKVTRTRFDNLWVAIVVRTIMRIAPVGLLFLVPNIDPSLSVLSADVLRMKSDYEGIESGGMEMEPLVENTVVEEDEGGATTVGGAHLSPFHKKKISR